MSSTPMMPVLEWGALQRKIQEIGLVAFDSKPEPDSKRYIIFAKLKNGEEFMIGYANEHPGPVAGISKGPEPKVRMKAQWKQEQRAYR